MKRPLSDLTSVAHARQHSMYDCVSICAIWHATYVHGIQLLRATRAEDVEASHSLIQFSRSVIRSMVPKKWCRCADYAYTKMCWTIFIYINVFMLFGPKSVPSKSPAKRTNANSLDLYMVQCTMLEWREFVCAVACMCIMLNNYEIVCITPPSPCTWNTCRITITTAPRRTRVQDVFAGHDRLYYTIVFLCSLCAVCTQYILAICAMSSSNQTTHSANKRQATSETTTTPTNASEAQSIARVVRANNGTTHRDGWEFD